jgi:hypothetical protein
MIIDPMLIFIGALDIAAGSTSAFILEAAVAHLPARLASRFRDHPR